MTPMFFSKWLIDPGLVIYGWEQWKAIHAGPWAHTPRDMYVVGVHVPGMWYHEMSALNDDFLYVLGCVLHTCALHLYAQRICISLVRVHVIYGNVKKDCSPFDGLVSEVQSKWSSLLRVYSRQFKNLNFLATLPTTQYMIKKWQSLNMRNNPNIIFTTHLSNSNKSFSHSIIWFLDLRPQFRIGIRIVLY